MDASTINTADNLRGIAATLEAEPYSWDQHTYLNDEVTTEWFKQGDTEVCGIRPGSLIAEIEEGCVSTCCIAGHSVVEAVMQGYNVDMKILPIEDTAREWLGLEKGAALELFKFDFDVRLNIPDDYDDGSPIPLEEQHAMRADMVADILRQLALIPQGERTLAALDRIVSYVQSSFHPELEDRP